MITKSSLSILIVYLHYTYRYGIAIDDDKAKTYLSFAVAIRFASGCISGLSSSAWANKFGRQRSLLYCQAFCILGALLSCKI